MSRVRLAAAVEGNSCRIARDSVKPLLAVQGTFGVVSFLTEMELLVLG